MTEHSQETKIAILEAKVEHMMGHVKELTLRVRANEKVVASVSLLGVIACTIIGAGYFAPKAESAPSAGQWIQDMRNWKSEREREPIDQTLNSALIMHEEESYGCDDTTESEELLQLSSDKDRQGFGWRYDRCSNRSLIRFIQERTGKNCGCRHSREED